jgi:hypothetical protein
MADSVTVPLRRLARSFVGRLSCGRCWLGMLLVCTLAGGLRAQPADTAPLKEIETKLRKYFNSIEALEAEYVQAPVEDPLAGQVSTLRWMQAGKRELIALNSEPGGAARMVPHGWTSFDGELTTFVVVDNDFPHRVVRIERSPKRQDMFDGLPTPLQFLGHPFLTCREQLVDLLKDAKSVASERLGQADVLRVELPRVTNIGETVYEATVWLDRGEGYLPRRFFLREPGVTAATDAKSGRQFMMIDIVEFMDVKSESTNEVIRFPKRAHMTAPGGMARYDFIEVRINHRPPPARFEPHF